MEKKLPEGWEWKTLGQICKPVNNANPGLNPQMEFNYIDIDSINNKTQEITKPKVILGKDAPSRARQVVHNGDILFSIVRPYLKNIARVNEKFDHDIASTGFSIIRLDTSMDRDYVFHYVRNNNFLSELERYYKGSNYPAINESDLMSQSIPVPPMETQQKIVAILDKAEETSGLTAHSNELTQELLQGLFLEMFGVPEKNPKGWKVITLENMCSYIVDCPHSTPKYLGENRTFPCIRTTELKNGFMNWSEMKYVDESEYLERTRRLKPVDGDIIFVEKGHLVRLSDFQKDTISAWARGLCCSDRIRTNVIRNFSGLY